MQINNVSGVIRIVPIAYYTFTIVQSEHQTITVHYDGNDYTSSFRTESNKPWSATIVADEGYVAGTLSQSGGQISNYVYLTATEATLEGASEETYTVNIEQGEGTVLSVKNGTTNVQDNDTFASDTDLDVDVTTTNNDDFDKAQALIYNSDNEVIDGICIVKIQQTPHQTITVTCNGQEYTSNFNARYDDTWSASVVADSGYEAGHLLETEGTVTENTVVRASGAMESRIQDKT